MSSAGSQIYEFGDYRVDAIRRVLTDGDGNRVELTGKAFDALIYFLRHPGIVIDRSTLLGALWPDTVVEENNLNQTVAALRRALGRDYITTVPRRGYQFAAEVRKKADLPSSGSSRDGSPLSRKSVVASVVGIVVVVVAYVIFGAISKAPVGVQRAPKVAVLPCDNLSPDAKDAYLALSLHQEILEQLGKLGGLLVVSRSSMMNYADDRPPVPEIAELLGATAVMECSVRYSAGRVIVTAQLIDPETDSQIWSQSFPGDLADVSTVINIQAEIATQVAGALGVDYLPAEQQRLERAPTASLDAYAEYLRAKQSVTWGGYSIGYSNDDFHRHINKAIEADPDFALAYSDRAIGHLSRSMDALISHHRADEPDANNDAPGQVLSLARQDATRALDLDPTIGRAHAVLGAVEHVLGKTESAHSRFRRAIESSPNDAEILSFIVGFYLRGGQQREALELLAHIKRLDPVDRDVGFYFYLAGDRKTALQLLRRMLKLNPDDAYIHSLIGYCLAIDGMAEDAEPALRLAEELYRRNLQVSQQGLSPGTLSTLAYSYSRIGLADDVQRLSEQFKQVSDVAPVHPMRRAEIHLALGNVDRAYDVLSVIAERALPPFVSLELDFVLNTYNDPVLEEPQFVALRRKLGGEAFPE
ncbi:MAG: winged helix-turn-helix domain-containing protein [Woeseiaceae bacterium]|nr:winged helix-turn-helix domain-containing protein [Woeseiaceae bacterium]